MSLTTYSRLILAFTTVAAMFSCNQDDSAASSTALLPGSTGGSLEVMVVMEDSLWDGSAGEEVRKALTGPQVGLPQSEPKYHLIHIDPSAFKSLLRRSHLLVLVDIDSVAGHKSKRDHWAKPQYILSYKGRNSRELTAQLKQHLENDLQGMRSFERSHILRRIARQKSSRSQLMKTSGIQLTLPSSFELATDREDISIYWSRNMKSDQCIILYERPLREETTLLGGDILTVRDSVSKAFVPGQFEGSYMTTEYRLAPVIEPTELAGRFAMETRGLWRVEGDFMGGPFLNYTIYDETSSRIVTVEGFLYAPELDKRNLLFELEAAMHSLRFNE